MISKLFDRPVYLKEQKDLVREIASLEDAIDYLEIGLNGSATCSTMER